MDALRNCLGFFPGEEADLRECSEEESKDAFDLAVCAEDPMDALRNCLGFFPAEEVDLRECNEEESNDVFGLAVWFPCRCSLSRRGESFSLRGDLLVTRCGDLLSLRGDLCKDESIDARVFRECCEGVRHIRELKSSSAKVASESSADADDDVDDDTLLALL